MYKNIVTQCLKDVLFDANNISVGVLRLDLVHPVVSGNKWFKLKKFLEDALLHHKKGIVSFGGAYSNHLVSMAYLCAENGLSSAGIIRGEEPAVYGPSLEQMKAYGMKLVFVTREAYQNKETLMLDFLQKHGDYYAVPEGGQGRPGIEGASTMMQQVEKGYTHILCAVGTGTTLAGIVNGSPDGQQVIGISALKVADPGQNQLLDYIDEYTTQKNYRVLFDYHFGGYAKKTDELIGFMNELFTTQHIPTDFVYTGKLFYALYDLVKKEYFPEGSKLLVIHSGGLQGNRSLENRVLRY